MGLNQKGWWQHPARVPLDLGPRRPGPPARAADAVHQPFWFNPKIKNSGARGACGACGARGACGACGALWCIFIVIWWVWDFFDVLFCTDLVTKPT